MPKTAFATALLFICLNANALANSPLSRNAQYGTGFSAPTVSGKDNVSHALMGDIVYDSLDNIFFGYTGGNWAALSVGVNNGTPYTLPTTGQIVFDTSTSTFKGWDGSGWITFSASSSSGVPSGTVTMTAAPSCPTGYLAADGSAVSRTTYSTLYNLICPAGACVYGSGDGSTTFNLPNAQGVFIRGAGSQTIGSTTYTGTRGTSQNDAFASHTHTLTSPAGGAFPSVGIQGFGFTFSGGTPPVATTSSAGSGSETRPGNIVLKYCIAY